MKRKIIIIGILMGILLSFIQWPIHFERSFQCVDYTIGESDSQTVNVSIQGTHYYSVLRTNYLKYTMSIGDYVLPSLQENDFIIETDIWGMNKNESKDSNILSELVDMNKGHKAYIRYPYYSSSINRVLEANFGTMYMSKDYKDLVITVNKSEYPNRWEWRNTEGYRLIASRDTITGAEELFTDILQIPLHMDGIGE